MAVLFTLVMVEGVFSRPASGRNAARIPNRDSAAFAEVGRLDVGRPNAGANLPFGDGLRHCLAMALARAEAEIVLDQDVQRFGHMVLVGEPLARSRFVLRGYETITTDAKR
jgi:cytochrome P450